MAYKKLKFWFDAELAQMLAEKICPLYADFDSAGFIAAVKDGVDPLELKDRVALMADALRERLPQDYPTAIGILTGALGPENPNETGMFTEFYWVMPIAAFVERHGLDNFEVSMNAIAEITKRNTGEYCIRPFIEKNSERTLAQMLRWANSDNFHLRRLASEGCRPRLPWAKKLQMFIDDPTPTLPILNILKDDPVLYVRKSVANHVNDILKDQPQMALSLLQEWAADATANRRWIILHALRNLRKHQSPLIEPIMKSLKSATS